MAAGTQNNYRSQLRGVGAAVLGPDVYPPAPLRLPKADPVAPYSPAEVAAFRSWARGLPTERYRDNVAVILAFALGAGLSSQEINRLVGTDVTVDDDGVTVHVIGERTRDVPVLAAYEDEVAKLARRAEEGPVFLPGRSAIDRKQVPNFLFRCPKGPMGRPNVDRLRNTWIVGHLSAGTHLSALGRGRRRAPRPSRPLPALRRASGARDSPVASCGGPDGHHLRLLGAGSGGNARTRGRPARGRRSACRADSFAPASQHRR